MYDDNEYGRINNSGTPTGRSQGTGTYTDYIGYGEQRTTGYSQDDKPHKKGKGKTVVGIIAILLAGILAGSGISYAIMSSNTGKTEKTETVEDATNADDTEVVEEEKEPAGLSKGDDALASEDSIPSTATEGDMTVAQVAENCLPSVVAITNIGEQEVRSMWGNFTQESQSCGSGIMIGETDDELLILTNYHVVADSNSLSVVFSWEEGEAAKQDADIINAVVKDYDSVRDIAVIAIKMSDLSAETKSRISIATVGSSDDLKLGEQVVAIGNALGYGQSVTTGIVSALDRHLESDSSSSASADNTYIQTDAAINPGNSGGAMFNMRGELVGVNSAKIGGNTVEGMGYAIPISEIVTDVEDMMNRETREELPESERGYLGISIVDVTDEINAVYGIPKGIYISAIETGSGAEAAGLKKEEVIVALNGKRVSNSSELKSYLAYYGKGEVVTVTVAVRGADGYTEEDVDVTLGESQAISNSSSSQNQTEDNSGSDNGNGTGNGYNFNFSLPFGNFGN